MSALSRWQDFRNRREPGALWMLGLLALLGMLLLPDGITCLLTMSGSKYAWAALGLVFTLSALFSQERWSLPTAAAYPEPRWAIPTAARRWVLLMAAASVVLALWPRTARLDRDITESELSLLPGTQSEKSSKLWLLDLTGARKEIQTDEREIWSELESRAAWKLSGLPPETPPSASTLRTPPWISGLLTVALVTLLAAAMGSPRAGLAAGLILAMHPLHVRWSTEVGGLSTMLLAFVGALLCLLQVLHTNRWRWWGAFLAVQVVALLCHPAAWIGLLCMNLVASVVMKRSPASPRDCTAHIGRLYATQVFLMVLMLILPSTVWPADGGDFWPRLLADGPLPGEMDSDWRGVVGWLVLPLLALTGVFALLRQDWRTRLVAGTLLLSAALAALLCGSATALPFALLLLPLALSWSGMWFARFFKTVPQLAQAPLAAAIIYVMATSPALRRRLGEVRAPLREFAALAQADGSPARTVTAMVGYESRIARHADPGVVLIQNRRTLQKLVDAAYVKEHTLYVFHSMAPATLRDWPLTMKELLNRGRFPLVREFQGAEPETSWRLYRYQPTEQIIHLEVKPEKK